LFESISKGVESMSQSNLSVSAQEKLLTPSEVATLFRVDPKTVTRWAKAGKLTSIKTLGGHRRYRESEVKVLLKSTLGDSVPHSSAEQIGENKI
jgi:excisionase family DNA binding protein